MGILHIEQAIGFSICDERHLKLKFILRRTLLFISRHNQKQSTSLRQRTPNPPIKFKEVVKVSRENKSFESVRFIETTSDPGLFLVGTDSVGFAVKDNLSRYAISLM